MRHKYYLTGKLSSECLFYKNSCMTQTRKVQSEEHTNPSGVSGGVTMKQVITHGPYWLDERSEESAVNGDKDREVSKTGF